MWEQVEQSLHASMARVTTKVAMLLPGILAFVVVLVVSLAVAWLLSWVVRKILTAARFDERVSQGTRGISEWAPTYTPSIVLTRTVFWGFVIIGLLVGVSAFEAASAESGISEYIFTYVPHIISAAILLLVGNIIARFLSRSVLVTAVNLNLHYARLLATGVKWLVMVLVAAMVLDHLSIGGEIVDLAFGILFGGIVLALALAVGLGSRDLVSRSLEKEATKPVEMPAPEERLRHF